MWFMGLLVYGTSTLRWMYPYLCPTITPISDSFSPICAHACFYSQGCNQCKCMTWLNVTGHYSLHGNGCNLLMQITIYNDLLWKFISNSYYFKKIIFLRITSLHPKFYMSTFLWDVESSPNYTYFCRNRYNYLTHFVVFKVYGKALLSHY
jgi:hypothetical protein